MRWSRSIPKRNAEFIEPVDCAPVSRLPDGAQHERKKIRT